MSINPTDVTLPITDWTKDNHDLWKVLEDARDRKTKNLLYDLTGKHGRHLYDILKIKE